MSAQPVAKTTPLEFIRQVQAETKKVVWPTRRETI
ncbi:preprotein translocase subunit SecE, partial [Pseudomonas proteolytica]|nr:preprotein translocase subunit SecE [Heyndrickxia coagulans]